MSQNFIPLSVPNLKGKELEYVTHAVETEWVSTGGPYVNDFEEKIAEYVKCKGAVSCQNGTAGLHIALMLQDVTRNDEVIVPTLTFIAAVNPVKYIGAEPIFMDCDDSLCMDGDKLLDFCQNECQLIDGKLINNKTKKHIKVVLVVHVFGNMADMEKIMDVANRYNLKVIEDATEAIGTYYIKGKYKGKCAGTIGHMGVYSFNGNKIMTTGGGGMITTDDEEAAEHIKFLVNQARDVSKGYYHPEIGFNYRMTNLEASLGLAQLERLPEFLEKKRRFNKIYRKILGDYKYIKFQEGYPETESSWWLTSVLIDHREKDIPQIQKELKEKGIPSRRIFVPIVEFPPYKRFRTGNYENAYMIYEKGLNLPSSTLNTEEMVKEVAEVILDVLKN